MNNIHPKDAVYKAALTVLDSVETISFFQGHIHPEDTSHIAVLIADQWAELTTKGVPQSQGSSSTTNEPEKESDLYQDLTIREPSR